MFTKLIPTAHAVDIGTVFGPASSFGTVSALVNVLLKNIFTIAGILMLAGVIISGFQIMVHAGAGEAEKTNKSRAAFTSAIVGLIIIVGAYFLIEIVQVLTGVKILNPDF